jgi:YVTN family beta-propeller protein
MRQTVLRWAMGALALGAAACDTPPTDSGYARAAGALTISADGTRLFAADGDNDVLVVIDPASEKAVARIAVGRGPVKAVLGPDGHVWVANRFGRSVSVVDVAAGAEVARIVVGAEPVSIAFAADGKTALVANNTGRSVSMIDVEARRSTTELALPADPTGLKVVGGKAYVAYGRASGLSVLDIGAKSVATPQSLNLILAKEVAGETRLPGQGIDPVYLAESGRLFVPHVQSKEDPVPTDAGSTDSYAGSPGSLPVVANAVTTIDVQSDAVLPGPQFALTGCFECAAPSTGAGTPGVPPVMMPVFGPLSGPSAAVLDKSGAWLFVTNMNSNNVNLVGLGDFAGQQSQVRVGRAPTGLALSPDGKKAYVYNSFDHTVSVLVGANGGVVAEREFVVGRSPLTPEQELGRRLFFSADDARMTKPETGGISCASCHPGGRDDGRTWQFSEGPRNTPSLAGRSLRTTAPYHWDGLLTDMHAFRLVVESRMGGTGTNPAQSDTALSAADFNAMMAYLETVPGPEHPRAGEAPSESAQRGKAIFEGKAACASCHAGPDHTDNGFHDVGTIRTTAAGLPELFPHKVNTPPLHNLFDSAPYLHDGSNATLRERVTNNPGDAHGLTSTLSESEREDLLAYLETL